MQDYRINTNYAKALFMLADEMHEQDRVSEDMRLVNSVCSENRELVKVFANPEIRAPKKSAIVAELFGPHLCKTAQAFLEFVVRKNRSVNLGGISAAYLDLYRDSRGIVLSKLTTAQTADDEAKALAAKVISDYTQKQVELVTKTDPSVIGGLALEFDNNKYDATISSRLAKLRLAFEENEYESKL